MGGYQDWTTRQKRINKKLKEKPKITSAQIVRKTPKTLKEILEVLMDLSKHSMTKEKSFLDLLNLFESRCEGKITEEEFKEINDFIEPIKKEYFLGNYSVRIFRMIKGIPTF